jgi:hypothetical protein
MVFAIFGGWVFLANKVRLGPGFTANQKALLALGFSQPINNGKLSVNNNT